MKRAIVACLCLFALCQDAQAETPLLQPGKTLLFERVLLREALHRADAPGTAGSGPVLAALTPVFVFERREVEGSVWLRVAPGETGDGSFWMPEASATPWRQSIVLKFTTLGDADRLLIFRNLDDVYDVVESEDPAHDAEQLRAAAIRAQEGKGKAPPEIISVVPELGVDLSRNFYMLPILETEEAVFETGGFVNLVKVAVVKNGGAQELSVNRDEALRKFSVGVVFAVDTTRSMGRYFGSVRRAVASIYDMLGAGAASESFRFGLVGFRDAMVDEDVEYLSRLFAPLEAASNRAGFFSGLDAMTEARASTKGFNEDSFAGVKSALDDIDWSGVDARFVVLITDAGPRLQNDELSETRLSAEGLAGYAKDIRGAHIVTLHLKTPAGENTHDFAESQYTALSGAMGADPLYFGVQQGSEAALESVARRIAETLAKAVVDAKEGREIDVSDAGDADNDEAVIAKRTLAVARSMQLDFLGALTAAEAPDVFEGWIADRDFRKQGVRPVEVRLLVTRSQLSDLEESLRLIVEKGEETGLEPTNFFRRVVTAAAGMSRRPDVVSGAGSGESLADAALIGEMLEGLPYRSEVMSIDEATWISWTAARQLEFLDLLYEKLERYRQAMSGVDNWVLLERSLGPDEAVYPMPLENLP